MWCLTFGRDVWGDTRILKKRSLRKSPVSNANMMQRGFYPALRRAGLRKVGMHDLRHTYASLMILAGQDVVRISRQMGSTARQS